MFEVIRRQIGAISNPRFFNTERGYQGQLSGNLQHRVEPHVWPGHTVVEEEYQKRARRHGITYRPDIIVHRPTPEGQDRTKDNLLVIELKRAAGEDDARADFHRMDDIFDALDYQFGLFLNIDSDNPWACLYDGPFTDRLHFMSTHLLDNAVHVKHHWYENGRLFTKTHRFTNES